MTDIATGQAPSTLQALKDAQAAFKQAIEDVAKSIRPLFTSFMAENPKVKQIKWEQYTPYFMDGDPCEFSIHGVGFLLDIPLNEEEKEELEEEESYAHREDVKPWFSAYAADSAEAGYERACKYTRWEVDFLSKEEWISICEFGTLLQSDVMEHVLHQSYGDHVQVIVEEDKITVEEYSHD